MTRKKKKFVVFVSSLMVKTLKSPTYIASSKRVHWISIPLRNFEIDKPKMTNQLAPDNPSKNVVRNQKFPKTLVIEEIF